MQGSEYIAEYLRKNNVEKVFGYQGGGILPLIDAISKTPGIEYIQAYHEQAAGFAADAYARITQKLGVAIATNGPGATNLISAIANAQFDFSPCLFITGQVNISDINKQENIRQNGFQEIKTVELVKSITKYAVTIQNTDEIGYELGKAISIAQTHPKGAVLIDIPLNIQKEKIDFDKLKKFTDSKTHETSFQSEKFIEYLCQAQRPVILAGQGIKLSGAEKEFEKFIQLTGIPRVSTLLGVDVFSENNFGFCGLYGNTYSNLAINNSDLLIIFGSRLSKRQIGIKSSYAPNAKVIQIDINENELGRVLKNTLSIRCDIKEFLTEIIPSFTNYNKNKYNDWIVYLNKKKRSCYDNTLINQDCNIDPVKCLRILSEYIPQCANLIFDVGQNQMWCAQGITPKKGQHILNSGGLGCMGFSLPASIGAYYADREPTIAISGDGGFQMNLQELQFVSQTQIPIKIIILNNQSLGMIQEVQMKFMNANYIGSRNGYAPPPINKIADCYNIEYIGVRDIKECEQLREIFNDGKPYIIEIILESTPTRLLNQYEERTIYEK